MKKTACRKCMHFLRRGRGDIWYDQYCSAKPRPKVFNPCTGQDVEGEYPHIREINDGNCKLFSKKGILE